MKTLFVLLTFGVTLAAVPPADAPLVLDITGLAMMPSHPTTQTSMEFLVITRHRADAALTFEWDFGDDTTVTTEAPTTTHRYAMADTYFLTVVVTDTSHHLTAKTIRLVTVR